MLLLRMFSPSVDAHTSLYNFETPEEGRGREEGREGGREGGREEGGRVGREGGRECVRERPRQLW